MIKNLITKKDLREINSRFDKMGKLSMDEVSLLRGANLKEYQIQTGCHNIFKAANLGDKAAFIQIDNGGSAKVSTKRIKAGMGTQSGFFDVVIYLWVAKNDYSQFRNPEYIARKSIFIEFKSIGGAIKKNQQAWHDFLKEKGESVHFCNNIVYFEKVIMKEIEDFLNG